MEKKKNGRLDKFFAGKGFYIVLVLCVAVIGFSVYSIANTSYDNDPAGLDPGLTAEEAPVQTAAADPTAPVINEDKPESRDVSEDENAVTSVWKQGDTWAAPTQWLWPVSGELEREYSVEALAYDVTMNDWRTHDGIDVLVQQGEVVRSAADGTVESVENDELYGTTVVISHGGGFKTTYSNLADTPTVKVGDEVKAGDVIGSVGSTALCEIGQGSHLHFAMSKNEESVNPCDYLPN